MDTLLPPVFQTCGNALHLILLVNHWGKTFVDCWVSESLSCPLLLSGICYAHSCGEAKGHPNSTINMNKVCMAPFPQFLILDSQY